MKKEPNHKLPNAIICDIDGTLALMGNRSPFDYTQVINDKPNYPIIGLINTYVHYDRMNPHWEPTRILLVTGREETCREMTKTWMDHNGVPFDALFMRPKGDRRVDYVVKQEIYEREIHHQYNVLFVLDDRNKAVKMWRFLGLTCLQVAPGDF